MTSILKALFAVAALALGGAYAQAAGSDDVVLTISGKVTNGEAVDFTLEQLEALGTRSVTTSSPWEDVAITYEGVPMAVLMQAVGATGGTVTITALNKYRTEIPVSDFADHGVILASRSNGAPLPIANKGPLFVIYPFDDKPELDTEVYHARSAWQVRSMVISE